MFTLAITTYNRPGDTIKAFEKVIGHPKISEVLIQDDKSDLDNLGKLGNLLLDYISDKKMRLIINDENVGMGINKFKAIGNATNDWVIIFDSDNVIDSDYLDAIPDNLNPDVIYCPSYAKPTFDYRRFQGKNIDSQMAKRIVRDSFGEALFNTCNYLVHKETYCKVFSMDEGIKATDTIQFNYKWLASGRSFFVVPKMHYFHKVWEGSGFLQDAEYNMKKAKEYKDKIL